jgi:hypothetical protein
MPLALAFVACGSAGSGSGGAGTGGTPRPTSTPTPSVATLLNFTVSIGGEVPASGSFTDSLGTATSCQNFISGSSFDLELTATPEMLGEIGFEMVVGVPPAEYHGPGTYTVGKGTAALQVFDLGSHEFSLNLASLQVEPNGSGAINFSNEQDLVGYVDSGSISWTCS